MPRMEDKISHFVTKLCNCVKCKKPNIRQEVPMQTIISSALLELIGIDFLHVDTCSDGYQYLVVIINPFTRFTFPPIPLPTKVLRLQLIVYIKTTYVTVSQKRSCQIGVKNLTIICLIAYQNCVGYVS